MCNGIIPMEALHLVGPVSGNLCDRLEHEFEFFSMFDM